MDSARIQDELAHRRIGLVQGKARKQAELAGQAVEARHGAGEGDDRIGALHLAEAARETAGGGSRVFRQAGKGPPPVQNQADPDRGPRPRPAARIQHVDGARIIGPVREDGEAPAIRFWRAVARALVRRTLWHIGQRPLCRQRPDEAAQQGFGFSQRGGDFLRKRARHLFGVQMQPAFVTGGQQPVRNQLKTRTQETGQFGHADKDRAGRCTVGRNNSSLRYQWVFHESTLEDLPREL